MKKFGLYLQASTSRPSLSSVYDYNLTKHTVEHTINRLLLLLLLLLIHISGEINLGGRQFNVGLMER